MIKDKDIKTAIPASRFPEFQNDEEWKVLYGCKVFDQISSKRHHSDLPILAISQEYGAIPRDMIDYNVVVTDKSIENYKVVDVDDFIISLRSFQGGIEYSSYRGICSPAYIILRKKIDLSNQFFKHYFKSKMFIQDLNKNIEGIRDGKMISYKQFSEILLPVPQPNEQKKIADCFGSLDDLISAVADKIEALKKHKKGLMQQLFPTEGNSTSARRFPEFKNAGNWVLQSIKNCKVDTLTGYAFKGNEISEKNKGVPLMRGINITEGIVRHNNDIDRFYSGDDSKLSKYKLQYNDLVIAMDGSKVGRNFALISKQNKSSLLVQRVARLRTGNDCLIMLIYQQIGSKRFQSYVDRINTSSGIPHISLKQIDDFEVWITSNNKEMKMVTDCLSSIDEQISAETQKLDQLQVHKKGLIQRLFPTQTK